MSTFLFTNLAIAAAARSSREGLSPSLLKVKVVLKSFEAGLPLEGAMQKTTFARPHLGWGATRYCTPTIRPLQATYTSLRSCSCLFPIPIPPLPLPLAPGALGPCVWGILIPTTTTLALAVSRLFMVVDTSI